ncbi:hypothetical protein BP5796_04948 [Coleophoma crateriformis]|uniref:Uncharacterized protein n=1 Tax=Coleophoma crateriformis TaxID=565419 RepID=A0A3D8SAQ5_9HELO|nr:hypothetical protein BP5796_04948 [Coleophoma crateriformis]
MKTFAVTTAIAALLASVAIAAPAQEARQFQAQITFYGAADAAFSMSVRTDGLPFVITNPLSISKIESLGGATCAFDGIDGSHTVVVGAQTVDVGPPQTQISGSCLAL